MKSLGISKFVYAGQNIEIDQNVINETQKIILNFIWDNKPAKVKREVMQQEIKNGGLNIINLEWMIDALKINWINRLQEENSLIRKLLDTILGTVSFLDLCRSRGEITDHIIEKLPYHYHYHFLYKSWYKKGLLYIHQLVDINGNFVDCHNKGFGWGKDSHHIVLMAIDGLHARLNPDVFGRRCTTGVYF